MKNKTRKFKIYTSFLGFCAPVPVMGEFLPLVHLQTRQGHTLPGHQQCTGGGNGRHGPRHRRSLLDLPVRSTSGNKSLIEIKNNQRKNEDFSNDFIAKKMYLLQISRFWFHQRSNVLLKSVLITIAL